MPQPNNPVEIMKVLNKSNCRDCNEATCMAFAAAVFKGNRQLAECPHIEEVVIERFGGPTETRKTPEQEMDESVEDLKRQVATLDLPSSARRLGGRFSHGRLSIPVCGKNVHVDEKGNLSSEIHIHPWLTIPIFSYILNCRGVPVSGKWVPLRELEGGRDWYRLFGQRCEKPLKKVADTYTDLFHDMLHIFNGKQVENHYQSDISLVLHPLPLVPILICYWEPEDGLESSLNVFFDSTAEENLNIEAIYALAAGLVRMFEKISLTHGS
jgi:uncharacterized protein DUF3786/putative Fe-S cluster protein